MNDSKLILILRKLPKKDFRKLGLMAESPFFNKKKDLTVFYSFLSSVYPEFEEKKVGYEQAHKFVFRGQKFNKKEVGYLMTDMVRLVEDIFCYEMLENDLAKKEDYLLETYNQMELEKAFKKSLNDSSKIINNYQFKDSNYYFVKYQLALRENKFFTMQRKHIADESLQGALNNLDLFYLSEKFRISSEILNRQNMLRNNYELTLVDELLDFIKNTELGQVSTIAIYSTILKGLKTDDPIYFEKLTALLNEHSEDFPRTEAREMYIHAINYCVRKIHSGEKNYSSRLLSLYKSTIEKELIFDQGTISPWTYMNIITIGIRNNEFEWTEDFIHEYKKFLKPQFAENAYNYNLAYFYFNKKEYDKAIELLNRVVFSDIYYNCESKALLLRIYYAQGEVDTFYSMIDSFRIFLSRNKLISENNKEMYFNLIRFIKRLFRITKGDAKNLQKLKEDIQESKRVINSGWLHDQIEMKMGKASSL